MYSSNLFTQALLEVFTEWNAFLSSASGSLEFTYAGLLCWGIFDSGKWTVIVIAENGQYFEYTQNFKRELMRDFASYLCEKGL